MDVKCAVCGRPAVLEGRVTHAVVVDWFVCDKGHGTGRPAPAK